MPIIKIADEKSTAIAELELLLTTASLGKKPAILQELKSLHAGIKGERESAYELDFHFGSSPNIVVIHDLRLELEGRVAQIDHLIINRLLTIQVVETKHFSQGLSINERGEFMAWYGAKAVGIPSPLSQNARHLAVLRDAFKKLTLPTRLGFTLNPELLSVVLIAKNAKISRPANTVFDSSNIMKADQFRDWYNKDDHGSLARIVSYATIEQLAKDLVALHTPITFDYRGKFGMRDVAPAPAEAPLEQTAAVAGPSASSPGCVCFACGAPVLYAVVKYCGSHAAKFAGRTYCRDCQPKVGQPTPPATVTPAVAPSEAPAPAPAAPDTPAPANKYSCSACPTKVPYAVAKFCWGNKSKFAGKVYCRECQMKL